MPEVATPEVQDQVLSTKASTTTLLGSPEVSLPSFTPFSDNRSDGFTQLKKSCFLEALRRSKGSIPVASELVGISNATVYQHLQKDPQFKLNVELVKKELAGALVRSAYTVGKRPEASGHADRKMLLRAWMPEEFGDRPLIAVQINGGEVSFSDENSSKSHGSPTV